LKRQIATEVATEIQEGPNISYVYLTTHQIL
jgi:hypothetical protein